MSSTEAETTFGLPEFTLKVRVPPGSPAWEKMKEDLPRGADLLDAEVVIDAIKASASLVYRGSMPDGTPHQRRSVQYVSLGVGRESADAWLPLMFESPVVRSAFAELWPHEFSVQVEREAASRTEQV